MGKTRDFVEYIKAGKSKEEAIELSGVAENTARTQLNKLKREEESVKTSPDKAQTSPDTSENDESDIMLGDTDSDVEIEKFED